MRAIVVEPGPQFSVLDVHRGICKGLAANGVDVKAFNLGDRLNFYCAAEIDGKRLEYEAACRMASQGIRSAAFDFAPSVVVIVSSFFLPPDVFVSLRNRGVHVVLWLTESPYEDERQIPMARFADTVIVNDPQNLDQFRAENPRTFYVPHSYDPDVHHDRGRSDTYGFSFVGTGYQSRIEFFEKVDWPVVPTFAGNWQQVADDSPLLPYLLHERGQCVDNAEAADIYRASACSANLYRKEAMADDLVDGWAMGPREVELAATATFYAREARGEGDELFPMLPKITTPAELADVVWWANMNPVKREDAARAARAAVSDRTFQKHAADVLRLIGA